MNKTLVSLILTIISINFISCQDRKVEIIELSGEHVYVDSTYLGSPISLHNDILISKPLTTTRGYYISKIVDNSIFDTQSFLKHGNGHHEFRNVAVAKGLDESLLLLECNNILSLTKIANGKTIYGIKDMNNWTDLSLQNIPSSRFVSGSFVVVSDSTILMPGSTYEKIGHIISIINYKNNSVIPLRYWPNDGITCDSLAKHSVYTDNSKLFRNNKQRYLYKCGEERFAFIFNIVNNDINVIKELYSVFPDYKAIGDGNYNLNGRSGHGMDIEVTDNEIYVLLVKEELANNAIVRSGNTIEVFDWDGNLIKKIRLDRKGSRIKLSKEKLYLFSTNEESGEQEIWKYNL